MADNERKDHLFDEMARLKKELPEDELIQASQRLQDSWFGYSGEQGLDPKSLPREMQSLELLIAPLLHLQMEVIYSDPEVSGRFFNPEDPKKWQEKVMEVMAKCFLRAGSGEEINKEEMRSIVQGVLSNIELSEEEKDLMEKLKNQVFPDGF